MWKDAETCGQILSELAVNALIEEAMLTPKPALVDIYSPGAHEDLNIDLMLHSAQALRGMFAEIGRAAFRQKPNPVLQAQLAAIGRNGEAAMLTATGGTNTHRGAIWSLGLLAAGAAMNRYGASADAIAAVSGALARYFGPPDTDGVSNGQRVRMTFGVQGAHGEARSGFPHVIDIGLPALYKARMCGIPESLARLDALMAIMSYLDDTCLLHRGGMEALLAAKSGAGAVLDAGGVSTPEGWHAFLKLDGELMALNASPGGSADLLAATLFLDKLGAK